MPFARFALIDPTLAEMVKTMPAEDQPCEYLPGLRGGGGRVQIDRADEAEEEKTPRLKRYRRFQLGDGPNEAAEGA